jgi:hypothetical protein
MTSVYISSTYKDLVTHREAVVQTILKIKKIVVAMEHYTADFADFGIVDQSGRALVR